jgi:hypothetical protein
MFTAAKLDWQANSYCFVNKILTKTFFEIYERSKTKRKIEIENICKNNCKVKDECLAYGIATGSSGLFGGVYLEKGKPLRQGGKRGYLEDSRDRLARKNRVA